MSVDPATCLGLLFLLSEAGLAFAKRAGPGAVEADRGSLRLLWSVIGGCVWLAFYLAHALPGASLGHWDALRAAGIAVFAAGLGLRWYSIVYLGKFFTVNVAIAADHRVIDTGPYRRIRHPSYTGALLAFAGLGLSMGNWVSLAVILVPVAAVFMRRIRIEEAALLGALGEPYREYSCRTKRLIPGVY